YCNGFTARRRFCLCQCCAYRVRCVSTGRDSTTRRGKRRCQLRRRAKGCDRFGRRDGAKVRCPDPGGGKWKNKYCRRCHRRFRDRGRDRCGGCRARSRYSGLRRHYEDADLVARKMTGPEVLDVSRDAIVTLIVVASPVMLVGLAVGVAISLLQALTQIQERTIAFVPKILAIFLSLLIALPFMAEKLQAEMLRIAARIVSG